MPATYDLPDGAAFFNVTLLVVAAVVWAFLVGKFLKEVGADSDLNGKYVRWCLRLEHGSLYRKIVYTWLVLCVISMITATSMYGMSPEQLATVLVVIISFRQLLTIDGKDSLIDMDAAGFDDVVFKFLPIFLWGADVTLDSAGEHKVRLVLDPQKYSDKLNRIVESGAGGLQLIQPGSGKAESPSVAAPAATAIAPAAVVTNAADIEAANDKSDSQFEC
jgi:hypothetical protein